MGKKYDFDYIILGSGPAGSTAALNLAKSKKHVALVEARAFGGSNINTRDVPYSIALNFAHTYQKLHSYPELHHQNLHFSFPTLVNSQQRAVCRSGGDDVQPFLDAGITCISGYANFLDQHTIAVGSRQFTAQHFIIATGSSLKFSEISGTESVKFHTPESALKLKRKPKAVFVVGGGSTGCELAQYFAELGTKVLIAEIADTLLPQEDQEVGQTIEDYFSTQLGITVLPQSKVIALEKDRLNYRVIFYSNGREKMARVDCIVLATGSKPNIDLGLENVGVKYKHTGITVDKSFQTSAKNIDAIGDVLGQDSSTERASYEGLLLSNNLVGKSKNLANYTGSPRITNTMPEVCTVGLNEKALLRRDRKFQKAIVLLKDTPVGKIYNLQCGFIKLFANRNHHIIGATIISEHAHLLAQEISLAIRHNLTALELASTPHPTNSYSYAIKLAAKQLIKQ